MKSKDKKRAAAAIEQRKLDKAIAKHLSQKEMERFSAYRKNPEQFSDDEKREIE